MNYLYKTVSGTTAGPVSAQVLHQLLLAGEITGDTLVQADGEAKWVPYRTLTGSTSSSDIAGAPAGSSSWQLKRGHKISLTVAAVALVLTWLVPLLIELVHRQPSENDVANWAARIVGERDTLNVLGVSEVRLASTRSESGSTWQRWLGTSPTECQITAQLVQNADLLEPSGLLQADESPEYRSAMELNKSLANEFRVPPVPVPRAMRIHSKRGTMRPFEARLMVQKVPRDWSLQGCLTSGWSKPQWRLLFATVDSPFLKVGPDVIPRTERSLLPVLGEASERTSTEQLVTARKEFSTNVQRAAAEQRLAPRRAVERALEHLASVEAEIARNEASLKAGEGGVEGASALIGKRRQLDQQLSDARSTLERAKSEYERTRFREFESDYQKFLELAGSANVPADVRLAAWRDLTSKWNLQELGKQPVQLAWRDGQPGLARGSLRLQLDHPWPERLSKPDIFLDEKKLSDLPNPLGHSITIADVPVGQHSLRISHPAIEAIETTVEIASDTVGHLRWNVRYLPAKIRLTVRPNSAAWTVQSYGRKLQAPDGIVGFENSGTQVLEISAPGYRTDTVNVETEHGATMEASVVLEPLQIDEILSSRDNPDLPLFPTFRRVFPNSDVNTVWAKAKAYFTLGFSGVDDNRKLLRSVLFNDGKWGSSINMYQIVHVAATGDGTEVQVKTVIYYQSVLPRAELERTIPSSNFRRVGGFGTWYVYEDRNAAEKASRTFLDSL